MKSTLFITFITTIKIIVGSLLAAVDGQSVLLMKFDDAIQKAAEALTSGSAFEVRRRGFDLKHCDCCQRTIHFEALCDRCEIN